MGTMLRMLAIVLVCGVYSVVVGAMLDGSWPDFSPRGLLVYVGGLVLIGLVAGGLATRYESRKDH